MNKFTKKAFLALACTAFSVCLAFGALGLRPVHAEEIGISAENFTAAVDLEGQSTVPEYVPDGYTRYTSADPTTFWTFADGKATSKSDFFVSSNPWDTFVYLAYKQPVSYAEIETTIKMEDVREGVQGWSGLYFGITNTTRRSWWPDNPHGGVTFCQATGEATYASQTLKDAKLYSSDWCDTKDGTHKNHVDNFNVRAENVHKLRLYKGHVEYYVNGAIYWDLSVPEDFVQSGECGIVVSNQSFTVSSFKVTELNEDGTRAGGAELTAENFTSAFDPVGDNGDWARKPSADSTAYWDFADGKATSKVSVYDGKVEDATKNFVALAYNMQLKYLELEATIKQENTRTGVNGWSGLYFGLTDATRAPWFTENPHGGYFFCQASGEATYATQANNGGNWKDDKIYVGGSQGAFDPNVENTHKLRVYEGHIEYYVNGVKYLDVTPIEGFTFETGECGVYVSNQSFTVSYFRATALKADGTPESVAPSEIELPALGEQIEVYERVPFAPTVKPAEAAQGYSVTSTPEGVKCDYETKTLVFSEVGEYTITVTSAIQPTVKAETRISVVAQTGVGENGFASIAADKISSRMEAYYISDGKEGTSGSPVDFSAYFSVADGMLTRTPLSDWTQNSEASENYTTLYFKDFPAINFAVKYSAKVDLKNSWHGLVFALANKGKAGNQEGATLFTQTDGKSTYWSGSESPMGSVGPDQIPSPYFISNGWNTYMYKVYGGGSTCTVEMYLNDMKTPSLKKEFSVEIAGNVGIFFTQGVTAELKDLQYGYLESNGAFKTYVGVTGVSFSEQSVQLREGEEHATSVTVLPESATMKKVVYASDTPGVVSVDAAGVLHAQSAGNATVTVTSVDDPEKSAAIQVTVTEKNIAVSSVTITNKDEVKSLKVGGGNVRLNVAVNPENATDRTLTFTSTDEGVVKVTTGGTVQIIGAGKATVTVTCGGKSDSVEITVTADAVTPGGDEKPDDGKPDDGKDPAGESGCGSVVFAGAGCLLTLAAGALLCRKKRK